MCGICGKLNFEPGAAVGAPLIQRMLETIRHRGPDDEGVHCGPQVGLGHRRLSIIDLKTGHQPLSNEDGTIWIVFNGEIYNFMELRKILLSKGHVFSTRTDTEVIVHLYEELGPSCVEKLRGMFAFAIWDANAKTLFLARDRVGIKPLYYTLTDQSLVFASEIKAVLADPSVSREIEPWIVDRFFTFFYVPGEDTLFKGIHKLPPAHYMLVKNGRAEIRQYWDLDFSKPANTPRLKDAEAELTHLLSETVEQHMISDVPVGILLSGGVDSSGVLSYATERTDKRIRTYTVGFAGSDVPDERPYARLAADRYGTCHQDMTISAADFLDFLPRYVWHMEEPVCEPPAVAMYFVSQLARKDVKVLLSGEGGDEAFAGYQNYRGIVWLERLKKILAPFNGSVARASSMFSSRSSMSRAAKYLPLMGFRFPEYYYSRTSDPNRYSASGLASLYCPDFAASINRERTIEPVRKLLAAVKGQSVLDQMLYIDTKTWLTDDLLLKADKMTMANSLELRVPLLDHQLLEFSAALPSHFKLKGFNTKYILKRVLSRRVPREILERRKAGFPVPYERWLQKDCNNAVRAILLDTKSLRRNYFRKAELEKFLNDHRNQGTHSKEIFSLVTLELWHRMFLEGEQAVLN